MNNAMIKSMFIDGVQYYSAYFSCPVCNNPPSFWVHTSCPDDHLYIGSDATLYCSGCGRKVKVLDAQYASPCHSSAEQSLVFFEGDNINVDAACRVNVADALCLALALAPIAGKEWVRQFLTSLG